MTIPAFKFQTLSLTYIFFPFTSSIPKARRCCPISLLPSTAQRVYLFTPAGLNTKLVLVSLFATVGIVGFLGNMLIHYFISTKKKTNSFIQTASFVRNFNFYIKSLALSDMLSNAGSVPLVCVQIMFDVFQHGWARV